MNMMNDPALAGMIPFDPMQFYEPPKPRYIFKMPRVVPNQKEKFESDDLFKRLHRDGEVRYTGFRDRPQDERQLRFQTGCREGHTELSFVASGTNVQLIFNPGYHHHHHPAYAIERECDFDKEIGKVSLRSEQQNNFWSRQQTRKKAINSNITRVIQAITHRRSLCSLATMFKSVFFLNKLEKLLNNK